MSSTGSIHFTDPDSGGDAWVGVRVGGGTIALASSLSVDGDIEMFFGRDEAESLRDALTKALEVASA